MCASSQIKDRDSRPSDSVLAKMPLLSPGAAAIIHAHLPPPDVEQYIAPPASEPLEHGQELTQAETHHVDGAIQSPKPQKNSRELPFATRSTHNDKAGLER